MRPRTVTQRPCGWLLAESGLQPGLQPHLAVAAPRPSTAIQLQSQGLFGRSRNEIHSAFSPSLSPSLSGFFSSLCFSEGLRGWPELVGEEVFPTNGSMLCVQAPWADRADLYCVYPGSLLPAGSPGRPCSAEREAEKPWPPRAWGQGWVQ